MNATDSVNDFEKRTLKMLLLVSVAIHMVFFFVSFESSRGPIELKEWEMDVDLMGDFDLPKAAAVDTLKNVKEAEELKVIKETLPQLPKRFTTDEEKSDSPQKDDVAEESAVHDDKAETLALEKQKKLEKRKKEKLNIIKKNEALERLLKERARVEKKFAKETQAPKNDALAKRKSELEGRGTRANKLTNIAVTKYQGFLARHVKRNYRLPDAYNLKNANFKASFLLLLTRTGSIKKLSLHESSGEPAFDALALATIRDSSPMPRPPKELQGQEIIFEFYPRAR